MFTSSSSIFRLPEFFMNTRSRRPIDDRWAGRYRHKNGLTSYRNQALLTGSREAPAFGLGLDNPRASMSKSQRSDP
jgi:hypothetical protein